MRCSTPEFFEGADILFQQGWSYQSSQSSLKLEETRAGKQDFV